MLDICVALSVLKTPIRLFHWSDVLLLRPLRNHYSLMMNFIRTEARRTRRLTGALTLVLGRGGLNMYNFDPPKTLKWVTRQNLEFQRCSLTFVGQSRYRSFDPQPNVTSGQLIEEPTLLVCTDMCGESSKWRRKS